MSSHRRSFRLSGIRLMCQASLAFSGMVLAVKIATATLPAFEVVFFRSLFGSLLIGALMIRKKISFFGKPERRKLLLFRGLAGFAAVMLHFYTISQLPLGTAVMLNYTAIIFVAVLSILFLGEKPGIFLISMILISFAGVYLLVDPRLILLPHTGGAVFLGILSAIFAAAAVLTIRLVGFRESPLTVIFSFTGMTTVGSLFFLPFGFVWPNLGEWLAISVIGMGSFYGQLWMTIAYRRAPASLVAPFSYLTPVLSLLYGLVFWKDTLGIRNLVGVFLIILGGTLISLFEARQGKKLPVQTV